MAQPTDTFTFSIDPVDSNGNATKAPPSPEIQLAGVAPETPWPRLWLNWMFNHLGLWTTWLRVEVYSVGVVLSYTAASVANVTAMQDKFTGTWIILDTVTRGGVSVITYQRTV